MKVINLNSHYVLSKGQIGFVEDYLESCFLFDFSNKIPVYLVDDVTMKENEPEITDEGEAVATEWLGCYISQAKIAMTNVPAILICPERIIACKNVHNDTELTWLLAIVIIHEFCHAYMDTEPGLAFNKKFYDWMEEPMANLLELTVVRYYFWNRHEIFLNDRRMEYSDKSSESCLFSKEEVDSDGETEFLKFNLRFISMQPNIYSIAYDIWKSEQSNGDFDCQRLTSNWYGNKSFWSIHSSFQTDWITAVLKRSVNDLIFYLERVPIIQDLEYKEISNYTIDPTNLEVTINGDVDLSGKDIWNFYGLSYVTRARVTGNVNISGCHLTYIPYEIKGWVVDGDFDCSNNNITDYKNMPTVKGKIIK